MTAQRGMARISLSSLPIAQWSRNLQPVARSIPDARAWMEANGRAQRKAMATTITGWVEKPQSQQDA